MKSAAIVLVCYNRLGGLKRLLSSLEKVDYDGRNDISLIFSIDNSGTSTVEDFAKSYEWNHGEKVIRTFPQRQGLKKHILQCGDFTEKYDMVIVLEDDIYVSDSMYHYAYQAVEFYGEDENIAGISLYTFQKNWLKWLARFEPQKADFDAFFMKIAMSWGQVWTYSKWKPFKEWLSRNEKFTKSDKIPYALNQWPESSWLKYHDRYCIEEGRYFVYPYCSLSTNCSDAGEHAKYTVDDHQVELQYGKKKYSFPEFSPSAVIYDEYMEREGLGNALGVPNEELCVCIWGTKNPVLFKRYVLTVDSLPYRVVREYGMSLRPIELNITQNYAGHTIKLYDTSESAEVTKADADYLRYRYSLRSSDYRTIDKFSFKLSKLFWSDLKRKINKKKKKK